MKKSALFLGLSLLSSSVLAEGYQTQVDVDYSSINDQNVYNLSGTYYFDKVTTVNTAWSEAAFMGRNNSVTLDYLNWDGDAYTVTLGGDYYHENFFAALDVTYTDNNDGDTNFAGEIGYFFAKNWLVSVLGRDDDFSDSLEVKTKYIASLSGDSFVNLEAAYINLDSDVNVSADYYWTAQSSVGLSLSTVDDYNFGINAEHFFTPAISAKLSYASLDSDDLYSIGLTGRF